MISIETAKNLEDLFLVKAAIMGKKLESIGGRRGVMEILSLSLAAYKSQDYEKSLKILEPLLDAIKDHPFESDGAVTYVSISDEMEWALYHYFFQVPPGHLVKNVSSVCPMDLIFRQYILASIDFGDYTCAKNALTEVVQWNPTSAKCRLLYAILSSAEERWDELLGEIICCMKYVCRSKDIVYCFQYLKYYFIRKKMNKEALFCSFLRSRYSLSNDVFMDILHDMVMLIPKIGMDYMNMCDEEMEKSCKKLGITIGFNPEVVAVAQRSYEDAFLAKEYEKADYFAEVMADLKTEQEKKNALSLRQLLERHGAQIS